MTNDRDDDAEAQRLHGAAHGNDLALRFAVRAVVNYLAANAGDGDALRLAIFEDARIALNGVFGPGVPAPFIEGARQQGEAVLKALLTPLQFTKPN